MNLGPRHIWWWIPLILFAPDLFIVEYARSTKIGALTYNLGHSYLLPALLTVYGWESNRSTRRIRFEVRRQFQTYAPRKPLEDPKLQFRTVGYVE